MKIYGEYVENGTFLQPNGSTKEPTWSQFYTDSQNFESGAEKTAYYQNTVQAQSSVPACMTTSSRIFPSLIWSILWVMCDHTGGPPTVDAEKADNDQAVGRIIDYITYSNVWSSSAIFVEEDDAHNGVDHVDGHRSPGYIVSPYTVQNGPTDHTYYTQVN